MLVVKQAGETGPGFVIYCRSFFLAFGVCKVQMTDITRRLRRCAIGVPDTPDDHELHKEVTSPRMFANANNVADVPC